MSNHQLLNTNDHAELRVHTGADAKYGDDAMAALVVPDEFRQVQVHYPIVFRRDADGEGFSPLALFGFESGENLFLEDGEWNARYRPLSMAIQPFLIGNAAEQGGEPTVHVDMDSPRISTSIPGTRWGRSVPRPRPAS